MVSNSSIFFISLGSLIALLFPVGLIIYFRKKDQISFKVLGVGILIWIVFSQILEKLMHFYFLQINPATVELFKQPFLYALYGGLAAGVFEEVGRFVGFRYLLKGRRERKDGIAYGIGHGGIESVLIGVFSGITSIIFANLINAGTFASSLSAKVPLETLTQIKDSLLNTPSYLLMMSGIERVPAVIFHIALSLIVLYSIRQGKKVFLLYAILLHAFVDFVIVWLVTMKFNLLLIEGINIVVGILAIVFIIQSKKMFTNSAQSDSTTTPVAM